MSGAKNKCILARGATNRIDLWNMKSQALDEIYLQYLAESTGARLEVMGDFRIYLSNKMLGFEK